MIEPPYYHECPSLPLEGARVIVLGGSPAVLGTQAGLDMFREAGGLVLGVNHILRTYPRCDGVLFHDQPVPAEERERFLQFDGALLVGERTIKGSPDHYLRRLPNVRQFELGPAASEDGPWPERPGDPLSRQGTSPPWWIQLAILYRANAVGVLGVDHNAPKLKRTGQASHCYTVESRDSAQNPTGGGEGLTSQQLAFYHRCKISAALRQVQLWNLSPYSDSPFTADSQWPRATLEEFISK